MILSLIVDPERDDPHIKNVRFNLCNLTSNL